MWKNARQISLAWYFCERRNGNLDKNCAGLATKVLFELPLQERVTQIYKALSISKEWAIADIFVSKMKTLSVDLWEEWKLIMLKVGWSFWGLSSSIDLQVIALAFFQQTKIVQTENCKILSDNVGSFWIHIEIFIIFAQTSFKKLRKSFIVFSNQLFNLFQTDAEVNMANVNHLLVKTFNGNGIVACFCGEFSVSLCNFMKIWEQQRKKGHKNFSRCEKGRMSWLTLFRGLALCLCHKLIVQI